MVNKNLLARHDTPQWRLTWKEANHDFTQVAYGAEWSGERKRDIVNYQIPRINYQLSPLADRNEGKVREISLISHTENVRMAHFAHSCYSIGTT
jgi:hypothetical protein